MRWRFLPFACLISGLLFGYRVSADEIPQEYRASIRKGLDWLAAQQIRDGHWEAQGSRNIPPR